MLFTKTSGWQSVASHKFGIGYICCPPPDCCFWSVRYFIFYTEDFLIYLTKRFYWYCYSAKLLLYQYWSWSRSVDFILYFWNPSTFNTLKLLFDIRHFMTVTFLFHHSHFKHYVFIFLLKCKFCVLFTRLYFMILHTSISYF